MLAPVLLLPLLLADCPSVARNIPPAGSAAAGSADFWTLVPPAAQRRLGKPRLRPTRFRVYTLNLAAARRLLQQVPAEGPAPTLFVLPLPDGSKHAFRIRRTAVMHPALAAKYPELQTFGGQDIADTTTDLRMELTPGGLRAQIIGYGSTFLIEPYRAGDTAHYLCFDKAALPPGSKQWSEPAPGR